jgi:hypothetical protein
MTKLLLILLGFTLGLTLVAHGQAASPSALLETLKPLYREWDISDSKLLLARDFEQGNVQPEARPAIVAAYAAKIAASNAEYTKQLRPLLPQFQPLLAAHPNPVASQLVSKASTGTIHRGEVRLLKHYLEDLVDPKHLTH